MKCNIRSNSCQCPLRRTAVEAVLKERRTAVEAVIAQAPGCSVEAICLDEYPIKVSVSVIMQGGGEVSSLKKVLFR